MQLWMDLTIIQVFSVILLQIYEWNEMKPFFTSILYDYLHIFLLLYPAKYDNITL